MTAHFIAQVVESYYDKLDLDKMAEPLKGIKKYRDCGRVNDDWVNARIVDPTYLRWCRAISTLESYMQVHYTTFQETELVYKWAKDICESRNRAMNEWRMRGAYKSFSDFLKRKYQN